MNIVAKIKSQKKSRDTQISSVLAGVFKYGILFLNDGLLFCVSASKVFYFIFCRFTYTPNLLLTHRLKYSEMPFYFQVQQV